jgi:hypothetical protein
VNHDLIIPQNHLTKIAENLTAPTFQTAREPRKTTQTPNPTPGQNLSRFSQPRPRYTRLAAQHRHRHPLLRIRQRHRII